jgi:glyoxylase I family protein
MGLTVEDLFSGDGFRRARLRQPDSGLILTLTQHEHGSGDSFSELRTGLDHLAFAVPSVADVDAFARRFEEYRVEYSERKPTRAGTGAMITLRDPDNIQLEVFTPDS